MSSLIQSKSTIDADQPVTVRPVSMWVNQCVHQRHAEPDDSSSSTYLHSSQERQKAGFIRTHARFGTLAHSCSNSLPCQNVEFKGTVHPQMKKKNTFSTISLDSSGGSCLFSNKMGQNGALKTEQ